MQIPQETDPKEVTLTLYQVMPMLCNAIKPKVASFFSALSDRISYFMNRFLIRDLVNCYGVRGIKDLTEPQHSIVDYFPRTEHQLCFIPYA